MLPVGQVMCMPVRFPREVDLQDPLLLPSVSRDLSRLFVGLVGFEFCTVVR